ncbi:MAG: beta-phosphoglucomutase [Anaerolineae bacterium]|nr:beta-phosphoglucomutase [Anaerolineae bacterium]
MGTEEWTVSEGTFDPGDVRHMETVFTIGNGYLGTRGSFEEGYPGDQPATLIHGVFDDAPIVYTELANCPNWLPLHVFVDGERFALNRGRTLDYQRSLDMRRGLLARRVHWQSPLGRKVRLTFERFASMADQHVLVLRCEIAALDASVTIAVQAGIDGYPDNNGLMHWEWVDQGGTDNTAWLRMRTRHTEIELAMAMQLVVCAPGAPSVEPFLCHNNPGQRATLRLRPGESVEICKLVTVHSTRDSADPLTAAHERLLALPGYPALLEAHEAAWQELWADSDVILEGDAEVQRAIRHSLFELLAAVHPCDDTVSPSAKTLSGFGYRGHVFWDTEVFVLPFLTYTQPALARNLLSYRYHTLPGARRKARAEGHAGAMFAWESAATGDEVTPRFVPGPHGKELIRIWCGDIELHISADVAYAVYQYWRATGDHEWMRRRGAEIVLETARFWESRSEWHAAHQRYEIRDVIGPDEYHEHVNNNAFTDRIVAWHLGAAARILEWLRKEWPSDAQRLSSQLDLSAQRIAHWQDIAQRLYVPTDEQRGLIEQFEGFFALEDIDLDDYEPRDRSMQVLLGIEGANRRQVLKQADVLMLLYLLRDEFTDQVLRTNWDYYAPRTDHTYGSSLGPAVHAALAAQLGRPDEAYTHFLRAARVDLDDVRGNSAEGIHAASAGGLWQAVVFGFAGVRLTDAGPVALPRLPRGWRRLRFRLSHLGKRYELDLQPRVGPPHFRAVIFDLDGVLTNTSEYHYLGWKRLADEESIPFDRDANESLRGVPRRESLMRLLDGRPASEDEIAEMMDRKNRYYQEYIALVTPADLLPGALELLDELHDAGIAVAIGSASKNAHTVIERLQIAHRIDAIADGYSVSRQKPAPDLFLHAAAQLGMCADECVVVEDAASGVDAALAGGMWTVGIGPRERVGHAHVVLPNLEGVRWTDLRDRLAAAAVR